MQPSIISFNISTDPQRFLRILSASLEDSPGFPRIYKDFRGFLAKVTGKRISGTDLSVKVKTAANVGNVARPI